MSNDMEGRMQDQIDHAVSENDRLYRELRHAYAVLADLGISDPATVGEGIRILEVRWRNTYRELHAPLAGAYKWIPVEEAAPPVDDDTPVLAFNGRALECWYFGPSYDPRYGGSDGAADCEPSFQDSDYNRIPNVTHWMPMLEGPKA